MTREALDKKINTRKAKISQLNAEIDELIKTAQDNCKHPRDQIYKYNRWSTEALVCRLCGLHERSNAYPFFFKKSIWPNYLDVPYLSSASSYELGRFYSYDDTYRLQYPERFVKVDAKGNKITDFRKWIDPDDK